MDNSWTINYNKNTLKNSFFIEQIKSICLNLTFGKEIINSVQNKIPLQSKNIIFAIEEKEKNLQTSILTLIQTINLFFLENNNEKTIILNENFLIFSKIEYDFCIQLLFQREVKHLFERSIGFFIRFLYFLEYLHSKLCQNILLYETDDDLYYSKKSFISFIDKLSLIFSSKMREISLFTSKISIERKILFRILKFLAYFKTLNHPDNLQQSQTKITNEDLLLYLTNYMKKTLWLKMEENRDELKIDNITSK